uniref:Uncharacterized protein n=1 Tax=Chromera velia CCMP2878 TaxID=1169474 RepID=A0A0G4HM26_9ALVE|mmetsp:Transcript_49634/g.97814  ORF Transcript_49634/g.97814 Transcript_49634/m.97814 type:complete len:363 (-) Transcript_49634:714-1802(-)|eukprot:Cvel_7436.t1-p1 / transcript=Cvel_7436.t1 / gene=Cvel_7436 / organism=Chromera_velia_CCMP2878 / gene_product=hypothetical protein / transcript_product=hypothetical protein / location=Cvel_scaffold388:77413-79657(+) / protein_length=362 / sequence_SO=supercontig / SO=protein_coding / is_pseudo=false
MASRAILVSVALVGSSEALVDFKGFDLFGGKNDTDSKGLFKFPAFDLEGFGKGLDFGKKNETDGLDSLFKFDFGSLDLFGKAKGECPSNEEIAALEQAVTNQGLQGDFSFKKKKNSVQVVCEGIELEVRSGVSAETCMNQLNTKNGVLGAGLDANGDCDLVVSSELETELNTENGKLIVDFDCKDGALVFQNAAEGDEDKTVEYFECLGLGDSTPPSGGDNFTPDGDCPTDFTEAGITINVPNESLGSLGEASLTVDTPMSGQAQVTCTFPTNTTFEMEVQAGSGLSQEGCNTLGANTDPSEVTFLLDPGLDCDIRNIPETESDFVTVTFDCHENTLVLPFGMSDNADAGKAVNGIACQRRG